MAANSIPHLPDVLRECDIRRQYHRQIRHLCLMLVEDLKHSLRRHILRCGYQANRLRWAITITITPLKQFFPSRRFLATQLPRWFTDASFMRSWRNVLPSVLAKFQIRILIDDPFLNHQRPNRGDWMRVYLADAVVCYSYSRKSPSYQYSTLFLCSHISHNINSSSVQYLRSIIRSVS